MEFVAIDFETATSEKDSACAVGVVLVRDLEIVEEYYTLIQPPGNKYNYFNTRVHGIKAKDTLNAPTFTDIYPRLKTLLEGRKMVAHNAAFDREVLKAVMQSNGLKYEDLHLARKWDCTVRIYRKKGHLPRVNLAACSNYYNIPLDHHNAISDALACAKLYMIHHHPLFAGTIPELKAIKSSIHPNNELENLFLT